MSENRAGQFRLLAELARLLWARADAGLRRRFAATGALVIATAAFSALVPLAFKPLVDALALPHEPTVLPALLIAAYIVAHGSGAWSRSCAGRFMAGSSSSSSASLR